MSITANHAESIHRDAAAPTRSPETVADLFPLPLTAFERFLLHGESADHPATFYVEMHVEGRFDQPALNAAFETAVERHPLLRACVYKDGWREFWRPAPALPKLVWQESTDPPGPPGGRWIDLRQESGLRVWVRNEPNTGDVLFLQYHHACTDGLGAGRLIVDLLSEYSRLTGPVFPKNPVNPPDTTLLKNRGQFRHVSTTTTWQKISNTYRFHVQGPTPLATPAIQPGSSQATAPVIATHVFECEETSQFTSCSGELSGLTINHVAVALLFRAVVDWQRAHGHSSNQERIRILMPVDLREPKDRQLPAANRVGFSFPTRMIGETEGWNQLLSSLEQEIRFIRGSRLGMDFLDGLNVVDRVPGLLPSLLRSSGCMATTLITNFGQSRRYQQVFPATEGSMVFGNVQLHHIVATPPISKSTRAGFGMCVTSGRLVLSVQCCPLLFDQQSANQLLQTYVSAWRQWAHRSVAELAIPC